MPFCKFFFITAYLIIIDNWIITLLLKITFNLIKKNVRDYANCDSSKKYLLYFIFSSRFLHLSLNRCDVKLKQFWVIDLLLLHWVLVSCIFLSISLLFSLFFPGYWLKSTKKNGERYSFAISIEWIWRVFPLTFHQMSGAENLL